MDHTFPGQASRNDLDVSSSSSGPLDALAYLSSVPELDGSLDRPPGLAGLGGVPQAFFPRRRYATRDYSTGSISSEDWLHHPEVVTLESRAPEIPTPVPDRLGLLGPLLSSSHTSLSLSSLSEGVSGRPLNGLRELDAARWTVASRIRQARLTRLLRLMGNREIPGYLDRYNWNRFAPAPDTQSMFNHASRSRGTSRAGSSIEDGTLATDGAIDHEGDVESEDPLHPHQQQATRDFVSGGPSRLYPAPCHTFAEILDCNGNPIECCSTSSSSGLSESYASSSTSSIHSHVEDGDEDGDWYSLSEARRLLNRRNRPRRHDDSNWGHGTTHPGSLQPGSRYGRTRVVSTGTVFEGLEHVSEADSLIENNRYQSLKSSWMTNPNGESWSDDEGDNPQRNYLGDDDKETDATSTARQGIGGSMHATLGSRHPNAPPGQPRGQELYYIYGNVRNRYGPDMSSSSFRRRRVMTEITDLLRREREWERELSQQYSNGEDVFGLFDMETSSQVPSQPSLPLQPSISTAPRAPPPVSGAPTFFASANPPRVDENGNSTRVPIAATVTTTTTAISEATAAPGVYSGYANVTSTNSTMLGSGAQGSDGTRRISMFGSHPNEGFQEYEQGHSHYHTREEDRGQEDARSMTSGSDQRTYQRRIPSLRDGDQPYHPPPLVHDTLERPLHHHAMSRQPAVALMNRTPPLLPLVPQSNEPIAHQIRRLNNAHMINLQRRFAHQQQQQLLQQQHPQAQAQASALQLMTNPHSYHGPNPSTSSTAMLTNEPPLLSRGSRSSFRSSEIDGANFNTREDGSLENTTYFGTRSSSSAPPSTIGGAPTLALTSSLATSSTSPVPTLSSSSTMVPPSSSSSSIAYAPSLVNQDPHNRAQYWRNVTRGSNSLYTNYEGGNLQPEDRWRRGGSEMIGR
ncbi:hypothetical protein BGZ59_007614 [Podila verticillata]|nr:hypothetical protein BGZ59_007614 [Podila verticillata]